jgi:hypothetical protein
MIYVGVWPKPFLDTMQGALHNVVKLFGIG